MLYVIRLTKGDCIIAAGRDEQAVCDMAKCLAAEDGETVASIRAIGRLGIRLSPNDEGSVEIHSWDDSTLDDGLVNEYPLLNQAFHAANAVPLIANVPSDQVQSDHPRGGRPRGDRPFIAQLKQAHEQNTEIIRKGLRLERQRFAPAAGPNSEAEIGSESKFQDRRQDRRKEERRAAHR